MSVIISLEVSMAKKVAEYVTEDTESILILLKKNIDDMNQSQIYTQISNAAQAKAGSLQNIQITGKKSSLNRNL